MDTTTSLVWDHQITGLSIRGNEAVAAVTAKFSGQITAADGKQQTLVLDTISREIWTNAPEGWLLNRVDVLTNKASVNGRPR